MFPQGRHADYFPINWNSMHESIFWGRHFKELLQRKHDAVHSKYTSKIEIKFQINKA